MFENRQRFSIKKLTIGVVSVFIGFGFAFANISSSSAQELKIASVDKTNKSLSYNYLDYDELTETQRNAIIRETPKDVANSEKVYYFVYKLKNDITGTLPQTGVKGNIGYSVLGMGLMVLAVGIKKNRKKAISSLLILSIVAPTIAYPIKTYASGKFLQEYNKTLEIKDGNLKNAIIDIPNYKYIGYFTVEKKLNLIPLKKKENEKTNLSENEQKEKVGKHKSTYSYKKKYVSKARKRVVKQRRIKKVLINKPIPQTNIGNDGSANQAIVEKNVNENISNNQIEVVEVDTPTIQPDNSNYVNQINIPDNNPIEPKVEEPKVEEPKVEEPKVEEPKVEEPKGEEPKVEEPKGEEPKVEEPKVEEPNKEDETTILVPVLPDDSNKKGTDDSNPQKPDSETDTDPKDDKILDDVILPKIEDKEKYDPKVTEISRREDLGGITEEEIIQSITEIPSDVKYQVDISKIPTSYTDGNPVLVPVSVTYLDGSIDNVEVPVIITPAPIKEKPVVNIVNFEKSDSKKSSTIFYEIIDRDNAKTNITAKLFKGDTLVKEVVINDYITSFSDLEYDVDYRIVTELKYDLGKGETSEVLSETRVFRLEEDIKKVEIKNIIGYTVFKKVGDNFEAVSNFSSVPSDVSNYFIKVKSSTMSDSLFNVKSIVEVQDGYKVVAKAPELAHYNSSNKSYDDDIVVTLSKASTKTGVITSFKDLINSINTTPNGNFVLGADLVADEINLPDNSKSYIEKAFTGTLTGEVDGKIYSISNLKAPLFNMINSGKIEKLNLVDVDIKTTDTKIGALAKEAIGSSSNRIIIDNVNVVGKIVAPYDLAGIISNNDYVDIRNSSFTGKLSMTQIPKTSNVGGVLGYANHSNLNNLSVDVEINSISNDNNDRVGGVIARAENTNITGVYAKGSITNDSNSGQVGGIVGSLWQNGSLSNALSELNVKNGKIIHGDGGYQRAIKDNVKVVSGIEGSRDGNDKVGSVNASEVSKFKESQNIPTFVYSNNYKVDEVEYLELENANSDKKLLYENIQKLVPLYSKKYVVKLGNDYNQSTNLNNKKLISVVPMNNNTIITDTISGKNSINKLMLHYSDDTIEYLDITFKEDYKGVVSEYNIEGSNLIFTPENYVSDFKPIIESIKNDFSSVEFLSDDIFNLLGLNTTDGDTVEKRNEKLELLYLKDSFNSVKENIDENLTSLLVNSQILGSTSGVNNDYLLKYLIDNKSEILLGMAYVQKWYNINFDEINIKKLTSFRQDFSGNHVNELEWVANIGKLGYDTLKGENNFNGFVPTLSSNTGLSNVFEFIENYKAIFVDKTKSLNDWFKESSKAYIVDKPSKELPNEDVTIYSALKKTNKLRSTVLPLLTLSKEDVYVIKTLTSISFGIFERYVDPELEITNPDEYNKKLNEVKAMVDRAAEGHRAYSDFWYRIAPESNRNLVINNIPTWDSLYDANRKQWYPKFGDVPKSISEFFGPSGKWHGELKDGREAYANGSDNWFVSLPLLNIHAGYSVYAHEMTHNFDGSLYFGGRDRRQRMNAEAYARGMFESPRNADAGEFGINLINDFSSSEFRLHNATPDRFMSQKDLQDYYKGVFDVINTMDYAEASVLIGKPVTQLKEILRQMTFDNDFRDSISGELSEEQINNMNLQSIDDFIKNDIVIRRQDFSGYFGINENRADYFKAPLFTPYYGAKENPNGSSGGRVFRRYAFELLGAKGYEEGMLPYITNQYKSQAEAEGKVFSDSYIFGKIFGNEFKNYYEFKKSEYDKRIQKVGDLKLVTINYNNQTITIDSFDKMKELLLEAIEKDINTKRKAYANNTYKLKSAIFASYLKDTNEFRDSIYKV